MKDTLHISEKESLDISINEFISLLVEASEGRAPLSIKSMTKEEDIDTCRITVAFCKKERYASIM